MDRPNDAGQTLPTNWQSEVRAQLEPSETILAWFEPDLDERLMYARRLVVLTDRRLIGYGEPESAPVAEPALRSRVAANHSIANGRDKSTANSLQPIASSLQPVWQSWPLADLEVRSQERGDTGTLELLTPARRLAHWRYTPAVATAAHRFTVRAAAAQKKSGQSEAATVCPSCGAAITSDDGICASCAAVMAPRAIASLFRLVEFARHRKGPIALGFVLTLIGTSIGLISPYLWKPLFDNVLVPYQAGKPVELSLAGWYLAGIGTAAIVAWLFDWAKTFVLAEVSEHIAADLRNKTYAHLQWLSLEFFGGKRTGDLMSRVGSDTDKICNFLSVNVVSVSADVLMILMTSVVLLCIDWRLAIVSLAPFPIIVWMVYWARKRLRRGFRLGGVAWGEMMSVLADTIPGIRVVKAFAQEDREVERFGRTNRRVLDVNNRVNLVWAFFSPTVKVLTELGLLVVWAFGCWQVFHSGVTVGVLTAFVGYISRFFLRIESMILMVAAAQRAAAASQRIFEILDRVPSVADPVVPVHPGRLNGALELRGVRFKYGTREVLHGLDLKVEPGEMIGLVGASGAGKSTLINLICRFYDVAEGAILADGHDIRSFPMAEYRANIGIVLQDPFLFYGTIAENIAYGRPNATRDEIVAAARAARAHEFILNLPDGYDSLVGERGQSLSGGERQRVSIARALLIDPRILILDEATSSVDTETEREIQAALENLIRGRTTLAIAHRLSTLRRADRLVVLERGKIVEIGNHQQLLERPGAYARLHHAQLEVGQGLGV